MNFHISHSCPEYRREGSGLKLDNSRNQFENSARTSEPITRPDWYAASRSSSARLQLAPRRVASARYRSPSFHALATAWLRGRESRNQELRRILTSFPETLGRRDGHSLWFPLPLRIRRISRLCADSHPVANRWSASDRFL